MDWQPIETAPTDGTRILLYGHGKTADGFYGQPDGWANPKRFIWPYIYANPTHWAPLPAPPEVLEKSDDEAMPTWEVWSEGYNITGSRSGAQLQGRVEATTWAEACRKACVDSGKWKEGPGGFDPVRLTVWGCRLFDNEQNARASFG